MEVTMNLLIWNIIALPVLGAVYAVQFIIPRKYYLIPKCAGSYICVCTAALALVLEGRNPLADLLFWGLIFCMLGDFFIELNLIAGGISFGAGHILLIIWALGQASFHPASLVVWIAELILMVFVFKKEIPRMGKLFLPFIIYAAVLTGDFAIAAVLPFTAGIRFLPFAAGILSFQVSDMILGKKQFGKPDTFKQKLLMFLYYLALYLIAASLWCQI